jgi:hypothetical protein
VKLKRYPEKLSDMFAYVLAEARRSKDDTSTLAKEFKFKYGDIDGLCTLINMMYDIDGGIFGMTFTQKKAMLAEIEEHTKLTEPEMEYGYLCEPCDWEPRIVFLEHLIEMLRVNGE